MSNSNQLRFIFTTPLLRGHLCVEVDGAAGEGDGAGPGLVVGFGDGDLVFAGGEGDDGGGVADEVAVHLDVAVGDGGVYADAGGWGGRRLRCVARGLVRRSTWFWLLLRSRGLVV